MNELAARVRTRVERVRNPEYTGANRCVPCTFVNLCIAAVLGGVVFVASPLAGVAVVVGAVAVTYVRGYLVPGTPTLTKRYFPDRVLRWFEHPTHGQAAQTTSPETRDGDEPAERIGEEPDVLTVLDAIDAIVDDPASDDLTLDPAFEREWFARMQDVESSDRAAFADMVGVDVDRVSLSAVDTAYYARVDGQFAGQWESRAAFLADVAGADLLEDRVDGWDDISIARRSDVLGGLRICLDRCPVCDGPVSLSEDVVESCCRTVDVVAATCEDCGVRVYEQEYDPAQLEAA